ncbi:hypothetical protein [Streptomyces sp. NPDC058084]|uniref:hypothetical protein n=1 Tax=Streptomyces sp. NPDC058084 TaxID=3346333 RepID=UPI0036EA0D33
MFTPMSRERLADIPARAYGDRVALPDITNQEASSAALLGAWARIEEALHAIAGFTTDDTIDTDVIALLLHLVAILDGPVEITGPDEPPRPLTADAVRQRLIDTLTTDWPRMAYADHAADVADSVMKVILPIGAQLRDETTGWQTKAAHAIADRDRARSLAAALEQINAEATRLLRDGLAGRALSVLEGDGGPFTPPSGTWDEE